MEMLTSGDQNWTDGQQVQEMALQQAEDILGQPLKCGYKKCGQYFGVGPMADRVTGEMPIDPVTGWNIAQVREQRMRVRSQEAGHKQQRLAYADEISYTVT